MVIKPSTSVRLIFFSIYLPKMAVNLLNITNESSSIYLRSKFFSMNFNKNCWGLGAAPDCYFEVDYLRGIDYECDAYFSLKK